MLTSVSVLRRVTFSDAVIGSVTWTSLVGQSIQRLNYMYEVKTTCSACTFEQSQHRSPDPATLLFANWYVYRIAENSSSWT